MDPLPRPSVGPASMGLQLDGCPARWPCSSMAVRLDGHGKIMGRGELKGRVYVFKDVSERTHMYDHLAGERFARVRLAEERARAPRGLLNHDAGHRDRCTSW
jgi:hypothetical protein